MVTEIIRFSTFQAISFTLTLSLFIFLFVRLLSYLFKKLFR